MLLERRRLEHQAARRVRAANGLGPLGDHTGAVAVDEYDERGAEVV